MSLLNEVLVNLDHNDKFKGFCAERGVLCTDEMYGCDSIATYKILNLRGFVNEYKRTVSKVWYKDAWEWGESVDAMPFGGWQSEADEVAFLKALRKGA